MGLLFMGKIHKSFEDSLAFHNKLVQNKLKYLSDDIPPLEQEIKAVVKKVEDM